MNPFESVLKQKNKKSLFKNYIFIFIISFFIFTVAFADLKISTAQNTQQTSANADNSKANQAATDALSNSFRKILAYNSNANTIKASNPQTSVKIINDINAARTLFNDYLNNSKEADPVKKVSSAAAKSLESIQQNIDIAKRNLANPPAGVNVESYKKIQEEIIAYESKVHSDLSGVITKLDQTGNANVLKNAERAAKVQNDIDNGITKDCPATFGFTSPDSWSPECLGVYFFNGVIYLLNSLVTGLRVVAAELLNLSIVVGIYNFNFFVGGSTGGMYQIWKLILALVTSSVLPFILYFLIRQIIKNDDSFEKIILPILGTSIFVYFSFAIIAFFIDQANIFSIYIYRSVTGGGTSTLSDAIKTVLDFNPSNQSLTEATLLGIFTLITNIVVTFVFFQAAILMLVRTFVLVILLVVSPIMFIPETSIKVLDEWRNKSRELFINNLIMAPIFMFIVNIAIKIGKVINEQNIDNSFNSAAFQQYSSLISPIAISALMIAALMIVKNLSSSVGTSFSNKINSWTKSGAVGAARGTIGRASHALSQRGWVNNGGRISGLVKSGLQKASLGYGGVVEKKKQELQDKANKLVVKNKDGSVDEDATKKARERFLQRSAGVFGTGATGIAAKEIQTEKVLKEKSQKDQDDLRKMLSQSRALNLHRSTLDEDAKKEFDKKLLAELKTNIEDADIKSIKDAYDKADYVHEDGKKLGNFKEAVEKDDKLKAEYNKDPAAAEENWKKRVGDEYAESVKKKKEEEDFKRQTLQTAKEGVTAQKELAEAIKNQSFRERAGDKDASNPEASTEGGETKKIN